MNKSIIRVPALFSLIALLGASAAMAQSSWQFTIPFGFTVGTKAFAAGDYRVAEMSSPNAFVIRANDGSANMMFLGLPVEPVKNAAGVGTLTFQRYGERYFLSRLSHDNRGSALPKTAAEKEMIAARATHKPLDVVASMRK